MKRAWSCILGAVVFLQTLIPTLANARDKVPDELIGTFGRNPSQCRSFHRKYDDMTVISQDYYTFCGGSGCEAAITAVEEFADGWILTLQGSGDKFDKRFERVSEGVFSTGSETLVRCTEKDQVAGIGLPPQMELAITDAPAAAFSAFYAMSIPEVCPQIKVDTELGAKLAAAGIVAYAKFLKEGGMESASIEEIAERSVESERNDALYAVKRDAEAIGEFCEKVIDFYGDDGSIFPGLISDGSKKS